MYEVIRYQETNIGGTATILDVLINDKNRKLKKMLVASSRAIYGEGKYGCREHGTVYPGPRDIDSLKEGRYSSLPLCRSACTPKATRSEDSPLSPLSFYGLTKQVQEGMVLMFAHACGLSGYALRYQNVYGPGQSLRNPYRASSQFSPA